MRDLQLTATYIRRRINELAEENPDLLNRSLSEIVKLHPELDEPSAQIARAAEQIGDFGCFLKDIEQGLVDFPFDDGHDVVFLCWQYGERAILAWHPIGEGFADRRPLVGAPKPWMN